MSGNQYQVVLFVKPPKNEENSSTLSEAFEAMRNINADCQPQWISQEDCQKIETRGKSIYICDPFSGQGFEHLKRLESRIYGPRCLLAVCIHSMTLPHSIKHPVYNLAMKGVKICCTSMDKPSRADIFKKVLLMAGNVDSALAADVTHLVAGEVGSTKYLVAVDHNKSVMTKDWVHKVWEVSQQRHIVATDECFDKYKCPPFLGLTVCVSGFGSIERNQLKNFVMRGGGSYSGELKMSECTHLIVKKPEGAKYEAAKSWKIKIVTDRWLYDCMDKKRFLDSTPYEFSSTKVKTSTPERRSVAGPNLSDVSAISDCGANANFMVDETTNLSVTSIPNESMMCKNKTVQETRLEESAMCNDITVSAADVFLDNCKIYFSGVRPALEEKLKKIVLSGGGLRTTSLSENVTHVVVGETISTDLSKIKSMTECPYLVTADWLMDCFQHHSHLNETPYLRQDLGLSLKDTRQDKKKIKRESTSEQATSKDSQISQDTTNKEAPSDLEMADMLSQYMEPSDNKDQSEADKDETLQQTVQNNQDQSEASKDETLQNQDIEEDQATQEPSEMECDVEYFFTGKSFTIIGFDEDACDELAQYIVAKGGKVYNNIKRSRVIDIAIVPLMGSPVDVTVSEVLTNGWLQMCIQMDKFLDYDEHWISRPFEIPDNEPLVDCCITVSGYIGVERECIVHLAQSLGAICQDHLARKDNGTIKANTHLIVLDSSGSKKYDAAKKWKLPTIGKEWLLACISAKKRIEEKDYDILVLEQKQREMENVTLETSDQSLSRISDASLSKTARSDDKDSTMDLPELDAKTTDSSERLASNGSPEKAARVPSSSSESTADLEKVPINPMAQVRSRLSNRTSETESSFNKSKAATPEPANPISACRVSQAENITAGKTPISLRRQVLTGQSTSTPVSTTPKTTPKTPYGFIKGGGDTPGTFLQPGFKPKFNMAMFDTPEGNEDLNKSTPLGEVFTRQLKKSVAAEGTANYNEPGTPAASQSGPDNRAPLYGIVIAVAKKLGASHEEYNTLAVELGGDFSWRPFLPHVTHFVFQGRLNDPNKEFRKASEECKTIVSPHWLYACKEQNCRVDESLYPHNFVPNSFPMLTPRRGATPRSTRARAAATEKMNPVVAVMTPTKKAPVLSEIKKTESPVSRRAGLREKNSHKQSLNNKNAAESGGQCKPMHVEVNKEKVASPCADPLSEATANISDVENHNIDNSHTNTSVNNECKNKEMKKALTETLGNVLADASRSNRSSNRRKGKRLNVSGQMSSGGSDNNNMSESSPWMAKESKSDISMSDLPQSVQVTWDDPTGRLEEEKLAHRLARVCEPSQNTEDMMAAISLPGDETSSKSTVNANFSTDRSPTPEPPSLAFPLARPIGEVLSPQPVELLSEESSDSRLEPHRPPPVLLVSGLSAEEKMDYSALIEQLGGTLLEQQFFDARCTHLIVGQPTRNEKFLACIASGKWVLHKSYLEACRKEGKFILEEAHEWGSSFTLPLMQNMTAGSNKLAAAAHKWRKKVAAMKKSKMDVTGAFDDWKVLLCLDKNKQDNFSRLLSAGGATVSVIRPPFPNNIQGTHAFIDLNKVKIPQEDLEKLLSLDIHCMKPEFIPSFLTDDPPPDPSDFYPPVINTLLASNPESTRRKRHLSVNESKQKSKIQRR